MNPGSSYTLIAQITGTKLEVAVVGREVDLSTGRQ